MTLNLDIKSLAFCLMIACSGGSNAKEKTTETRKPFETVLTEHINLAEQKYNDIFINQTALYNDIHTQILSISCSAKRIVQIKDKGKEFEQKIKLLLNKIELLETNSSSGSLKTSSKYTLDNNNIFEYSDFIEIYDKAELKEPEPDGFFFTSSAFKDKRKEYDIYISKAKYKCEKNYKRPIPSYQLAKDLETKVFVAEIARAITRLNSFPRRFDILEQLAGKATAYQSIFQQMLAEYMVDKSYSSISRAELDKYKAFAADADKTMKQLRETSKSSPTPEDIKFVEDVFK